MIWSSHAVRGTNATEMIRKLADKIRPDFGNHAIDLAVFFVSPHFAPEYDKLPTLLHEYLPARVLIGCSAGGVVGGGVEMEDEPAMSLTAAHLPHVKVTAVTSDTENMPDADAPPEVWSSWLGLAATGNAHFIILADPFSARLEPFLTGLDYLYPEGTKIGGLASGARAEGGNILFLNNRSLRRGLVAAALTGNIAVDTIVAQGCRPIGEPVAVTSCQHNILRAVNGMTPLQYLGSLIEKLSTEDRALMRTSLFLGLAIDPFLSTPGRGDYLIRNLVGIDYNAGILAVNALLREGQIVQFHLRDRATSAEDLDVLLRTHAARANAAAGALIFQCVGRGRYLYGTSGHDSESFKTRIGPVPLGGFFCNGEIGPVGGVTQLHGYTSSFGLFRPATV